MDFPSTATPTHRAFIRQAIETLSADARIVGLACSGSYSEDALDAYSDLDFVVAIAPDCYTAVENERLEIVARLGDLFSAFTGEHVGEPRLVIALFGPDGLHVDFKFVKVADASNRVDEPTVLWERDNQLSDALKKGVGAYPRLDEQWVEDRFWTWIHYCAGKIGRGEYFEATDFLGFLRGQVLGPLALQQAGFEARGVRKIELLLPDFADRLRETVAQPEKVPLLSATEHAIVLYKAIRSPDVTARKRAEQVALKALRTI